MKKIVALLPMKGVSERVPFKNLRSFDGNPLYHIVLKKLLKSKYISEVIINTDGEDLKKDIKKNFKDNVRIIDRKREICGNYISMNKIIEDDIKQIKSDVYIQTHSTNPLLRTKTIDKAIEKFFSSLEEDEDSSLFSVTKIQKRFYTKDVKPMNHDPKMLVTQHLEPIYEENSCFYIFTEKSFSSNNNRIGVKARMFEINKIEAIDIDDKEDFTIAETLYKLLR